MFEPKVIEKGYHLSSDEIVDAIGQWVGVRENMASGERFKMDINFICSTKKGISADVILTLKEEVD